MSGGGVGMVIFVSYSRYFKPHHTPWLANTRECRKRYPTSLSSALCQGPRKRCKYSAIHGSAVWSLCWGSSFFFFSFFSPIIIKWLWNFPVQCRSFRSMRTSKIYFASVIFRNKFEVFDVWSWNPANHLCPQYSVVTLAIGLKVRAHLLLTARDAYVPIWQIMRDAGRDKFCRVNHMQSLALGSLPFILTAGICGAPDDLQPSHRVLYLPVDIARLEIK